MGGRIKGTLGDIDPLNKVPLKPLKRARSRVQKGYPLRGLPNTTPNLRLSCFPEASLGLQGRNGLLFVSLWL